MAVEIDLVKEFGIGRNGTDPTPGEIAYVRESLQHELFSCASAPDYDPRAMDARFDALEALEARFAPKNG